MKIFKYSVRKTKSRKYNIETPKSIWLRWKAYSFKCEYDNESNNNLKAISESQSKLIKSKNIKNV